jgi:hypothetical protein
MYLCIYVFMYIHTYIFMYLCIYIFMYIRIYVYTYLCIYVFMYICIYVYTYLCIYVYTYLCKKVKVLIIEEVHSSSKEKTIETLRQSRRLAFFFKCTLKNDELHSSIILTLEVFQFHIL